MTKKVRWIKHYNSSQKILLVGEGDFSFSACLAKAFRSARNMVATSFDLEDTVRAKHWTSAEHLEYLKSKGCLLLHGVDVFDITRCEMLRHKKFDVIIYNFPHAGHFEGLKERDNELIEMHKELVDAFFKSAREMLSLGGEVHVTHRNDNPYRKWKVVELAKRSGLTLKEKARFLKEDYPGYHNKRGGEIKSNKTFPIKACFTFKFSPTTQMTGNDTVSYGVSGILAALDGVHLE